MRRLLLFLWLAVASHSQDLEQPPVVDQPKPPDYRVTPPKPPVSFPQGTPAPDSSVQRVGGGVTAPSLLSKVEPEYSKEALKAHIEGTVILYIVVDPEGKATNFRVVRGLGYGLDEKSIEAVKKWKFRPGTKDGKPVNVAATIEVNWKLTKDPPLAHPLACTFTKTNCVRMPESLQVAGQMIQLSATQFAIFDGQAWHIADVRP